MMHRSLSWSREFFKSNPIPCPDDGHKRLLAGLGSTVCSYRAEEAIKM